MRAAFAAARPEVVYHLAAQIDVRRSVDDPSTDAHVNIGGTAAVLEARGTPACAGSCWPRPRASTAIPELPTPSRRPERRRAGRAAVAVRREQGGGGATWRCSRACTGSRRCRCGCRTSTGPRQNPHGEAGVVAIFCGAAAERRPVTIFGDGAPDARLRLRRRRRRGVRAPPGAPTVSGALNVSTGTRDEPARRSRRRSGCETRPRPGAARRDPPLVPRSARRGRARSAGARARRSPTGLRADARVAQALTSRSVPVWTS